MLELFVVERADAIGLFHEELAVAFAFDEVDGAEVFFEEGDYCLVLVLGSWVVV